MTYFMLIWFIALLVLVDIPQRMLNMFLLYCKRFDAQRNILYRSLLAANVHIDLNTLVFGSQIYNIDTNRHVFITVQTYIKEALATI
jgi:hypothetical protein